MVNPSAPTFQALKDMFGADIEVESVPEPGPNDLFVTRWNDSSPWVTGGELNDGVNTCTSGPGILRNGGRYILTAAHCFAAGANVFNGSEFVGRNNWVDTRDRGTEHPPGDRDGHRSDVRQRQHKNDYVNMSTVPWTSTEGRASASTGAYSGRVCGGLVVTKTNYCTNVTGRLTCGMATVHRQARRSPRPATETAADRCTSSALDGPMPARSSDRPARSSCRGKARNNLGESEPALPGSAFR